MQDPRPNRLATDDPWITVAEARAERGLLVAGWLLAVLARGPLAGAAAAGARMV